MNEKLKELYGILEQSKDFKGMFQNETELGSMLSSEQGVNDFYSALNMSEEFQGMFKDADEFATTFDVKKKELSLSPLESASKGETILQDFGLTSEEPITPPVQLGSDKAPTDTGSYFGDLVERIGAGALDWVTSGAKQARFAKKLIDIPKNIVKSELSLLGVSDETAEKVTSAIPFMKPQAIDIGITASRDIWDKIEKTDEFKSIETKKGELQQASARYDKSIEEYLKNKEYKKAIGASFLSAAESLPLTVTAMFGGPVGLAEIGAYSAASQYDELSPNNDMKEIAKISNALINGGLEIATEKLGSANYGKMIKSLYKTAGKEKAEQVVKSGMKNWLASMFKKVGVYTQPVGEALEEGVNQLGSNITARATGEDPERPIGFNVVSAMAGGAAGGSMFIPVATAGQILQKTKPKEKKAVDPEVKAMDYSFKGKEITKQDAAEIIDTADELTDVDELLIKDDKALESRIRDKFKVTGVGTVPTEIGALEVPQAVADQKAQEEAKPTEVKEEVAPVIDEEVAPQEQFKLGTKTFNSREELETWLDENYNETDRFASVNEEGYPEGNTMKVFNEWYDKNKSRLAREEGERLLAEEETQIIDEYRKDNSLVDEEGSPILLYHGTNQEFNEFDINKRGDTDFGVVGRGVYFTRTEEYPQGYAEVKAKEKGGKPRVVKAVARLKNPLIIKDANDKAQNPFIDSEGNVNNKEHIDKTTDALIEQGYDGVIWGGINDMNSEIVVFDPKNITILNKVSPQEQMPTKPIEEETAQSKETTTPLVSDKEVESLPLAGEVNKEIADKLNDRLVDLQRDYNTTPKSYSKKRSIILKQIGNYTGKLGYKVSMSNGVLVVVNESNKPIRRIRKKGAYQTLQSITDTEELDFITSVLDSSEYLYGLDIPVYGKALQKAIKDIKEERSNQEADRVISALRNMYEDGYITFRGQKTDYAIGIKDLVNTIKSDKFTKFINENGGFNPNTLTKAVDEGLIDEADIDLYNQYFEDEAKQRIEEESENDRYQAKLGDGGVVVSQGEGIRTDAKSRKEELKSKEETLKGEIADTLEDLMSSLGGIQQLTGEQRAKVVDNLVKLFKQLGELTLLKGEQLLNRVKEELQKKGVAIPEDVLAEARDKYDATIPVEATEMPTEAKTPESDTTTPKEKKVAEKPLKEGKTRTREIGAKIIESAVVPQDVKDALLENGIDYVPRGRKFTQSEAKELVDIFASTENGLDKLAETVYDIKNDIAGDTRVTLNVYIADKYSRLLEESTDPKNREKYRTKLADAFIFGQEFATKAGQTVEALKRWRELLSRDPESIIAIRRRQQQRYNEFALQEIEGDIKTAKEMLDSVLASEDFKKIVESEVDKEINKIAGKKYGAVDKKKIEDFFDGLLVKNDKLFDATIGIPIAVYNGSVLIIKKAVLAGVDITNAIKQGVAYIEDWYKKNYAEGKITSPDWNKDDYIAQLTDLLKPLSKKVKTVKFKLPKKAEDKLIDDIYAKMQSASKPQLRRLIREYVAVLEKEGAIDEKRFKDLFAKAIGLDVLSQEDEQKIRETAHALNNTSKTTEKLINKFKELVAETDKDKIAQLESEIITLKKETKKAKFEAQKAARKLAGLMTDKSTLGSTIHSLIQGNLLTPISLMSNVVGNTVFLPIRNVSYMTASALDYLVSKIANLYTPLLNTEWVKSNPKIRRMIAGLPTPSREYDYWASTRGWWYGSLPGLEEGIRQMWTGTLPEDQYEKYVSQGLNPWKATLRLRDQLTGKEQIAFDTALANFLEAFPTTYMTEAFFRTLNLGDKPYRRAAERSRLEEIATLKGLTGNARESFINNPDPDSIEEARKVGDVAVYQQDSIISELFSWLNQRINRVAAEKATKRTSVIISTVGALFKATQAPYVKTPINLIAEAVDYSTPVLSLGRAIWYAKEGNKRKSYEYFGKAIVGYMMLNMVMFLLKEGLLSPPTDDDDKIRQAQYDAKPGYSLNLDALWRRINPIDNQKGEGEWKQDDKVMNIQRLGVFSMILMGMSKAYAEFPPDEMQKELTTFEKGMYSIKMIPAEVGASLDQSFLSGTASGIKAFTEGGPAFDSWVISTSKALSAVIYPNTVAQISQVFFDENYIREVKDMYSRDEKFKKQIINTFKDRTFMGKQLPTKVTLWGERVNRVPEGESWAHVMFDVTKSVKYQKSSFGVKMFEFYERYKFINETEAKKILPSIPSASNTVGWDDRNMTAKEVEEFQMAVGQRRKSYVENLMNSEEWQLMADEDRITELERIYRTQAAKVKSGMFMLDVIKADRKVFHFLEDNDLMPVPTKSVVINYRREKIKLDPDQTSEYYADVQKYFVDRINKTTIMEVDKSTDDKGRERLMTRVNDYWAKAREMADREWKASQSQK